MGESVDADLLKKSRFRKFLVVDAFLAMGWTEIEKK